MLKFASVSLKKTALAGGALMLLAGCSAFEPDYIACPSISVRDGADQAVLVGADYGQPVAMRVNGVGTTCLDDGDTIAMLVELGMLLKRDTDDLNTEERVPLDVTFAFLDANDRVVSRHIHSQDGFISSFFLKARPVYPIELDVPKGTRVVMGLGKAE